ncbi:LapA family protein [Sulfuritalea hydrogenivorans]|jgi:uncharacterized integral membrane protein|uniref:Lipopolysaccharide assembly protein A domain-containing protein n=1 Tax=Sulfuritalea hydrogenivorans sk43H TaxID=1223802 RepID=W0SDX3_9PROT|nr:LapA family protein [Sulfuritalea hydrogenivorans]MDK9713267.1 LapA family protein [Sulfuritalea sp.]BAO29261.1 hypothetical protein SUTH_01462 [Sulfuritalea hydrogenivorans sk43H]
MQLMLIFGIVVAIGAVVFALQNLAPVTVTLAIWTFEGSLALVLLCALGLGALIAGLLSSPAVIRGQWTIGRQRSRIAELERQLAAQEQVRRNLEAELAQRSALDVTPAPIPEKPYVGLRALLSAADAGRNPAAVPRDEDKP